MNEDVKLANKKEDSSKLKGFIIMMTVCLVAGFIAGFAVAAAGDIGILKDMASMVSGAIKAVSMYANFVLTIVSLIAVVILYRQSRKMFTAWDGEDEDIYRAFERKLSIAIIITSVNYILLFMFMAIGIIRMSELKTQGKTVFIASAVIFIIGILGTLIFTIIAQQKVVNIEKEINPEKRGSVFDNKFQKKWIESCDELEKQQIFEASHASYKAVNTTCMGILFACILGVKIWDFGVLPICITGIIWLVSILSYSVKCLKFEQR